MKTAREIIAVAVRSGRRCEGEYPCAFCSWPPDDMTTSFDETGCDWIADATLAALAAEGFSIVETGREPATIEACAKVAERATIVVDFGCGGMNQPIGHRGTIAAAIRALSRSTREGKTE